MTTHAAPDCMGCRHLHRDPDATRNTCDAFPAGIPAVILTSERRHLRPYPGDRGIRFEPATAAPNAPPAR